MGIEGKWFRVWAEMSNAVIVKGVLIVSGYYGGNWIDEKLHTKPLFLALCLALSIGLGLWWLLRTAKRLKL